MVSGEKIGPYTIVDKLGEGGMGQVWRATDTTLGRQVAIKILPDAFASDPERLARFEREARTLAALNHPHIAAIYGFEKSSGMHALVMELVEGEDLSQRIARIRAPGASERQAGLPLDEALPIATQIAEALEAAHAQGIVHRDLKPANIKVRADGAVKVLDFGLAKAVDTTGASAVAENSPTITTPAMTEAGMILGTAAYMAPEQARGKPVDKRADIWAFGVVLFEMLTGTRAFDGEDTTEVLGAVVRLEPNYNTLPADVPAPVRTLLQSCLVKDPRRRVADISTALFVLDKAASLAPASATSVTSVRPRRGLAWIVAFVAVLGMAAMAVPALRFLRDTPPPEPPVMRVTIEPPGGVTLTSAPMISPDGTHVAFVAGGALYVRPLEALAAQRLPATEGAMFPFWSPDSKRIGFFADGKLKTIDLAGGAAAIICDAPAGKGGAWSRIGVIVFAPNITGGLQQVSAAGGTPAPATLLDPATKAASHRWPQFLPDGERFLYFNQAATDLGSGANGVFVTSLKSTTSTPIVSTDVRAAYAAPGALLFVRGTTLMHQPFDTTELRLTGTPAPVAEDVSGLGSLDAAFSVSDTGVLVHSTGQSATNRRLVWVDRRGKVTPLALAPGVYEAPALSPDGQHIALTVRDATGAHVWVHDIARGTLGKRSFDGRNDFAPIWTRDGMFLTFTMATTASATSVMRVRSDGSGPAEAVVADAQLPGWKVPTSWTPDGRLLALQSGATAVLADVTVRDAVGVLHPALATSAGEGEARFSPVGQWLSYRSNETGRGEVYVQSYPLGRGKWQISTDGGAQAMWAQNGKELFYRSGNRMMVVDVELGATFKASAPRVLFEMPLPESTFGDPSRYGVTPDAQRFLVLTAAEEKAAAAPIHVVLNYAQALKR
jgi:eukaryotic-like serine/threonine-protein kinase